MDILRAIVLGVVEGVTEFLPVSSTGHLIIARPLLGIHGDPPPWNTLLWVSQFGAILAVVVYFWRDLWRRIVQAPMRNWSRHLLTKLIVAMVPTVLLALLFKRHLDPLETMPLAVAAAFIVGAFAMELIDRLCRRNRPMTLDDVNLKQAFWIGAIQALSMWPGLSRSGCSIFGGMALGLTPVVATEFSFYLAIPTMAAASAKKLVENYHELTPDNIAIMLIGTATSFLVALLVIAGLLEFVKRYRFTVFAAYRVVVGLLVVALYYGGYLN